MPERPIPRIGPAPYRTYLNPTPRIGPAPYPRPDYTSIKPARGNPDWWNQFVEPQLETFQKQPLMQVKGMFDKYLGDPTEPANMAMIGFHGTGAPKFSKFSNEYIHNPKYGEGGTAYSWGHYVAGHPNTSIDYFNRLKKITRGRTELAPSALLDRILTNPQEKDRLSQQIVNWQDNVINAHGPYTTSGDAKDTIVPVLQAIRKETSDYLKRETSARENLLNAYRNPFAHEPNASLDWDYINSHTWGDAGGSQSRLRELAENKLRFIEEAQRKLIALRHLEANPQLVTVRPPEIQGGIAKVELPDEAVDKMLKWDAPYKEQPDAVKEFVNQRHPLAQRDYFQGRPGWSGYPQETPFEYASAPGRKFRGHNDKSLEEILTGEDLWNAIKNTQGGQSTQLMKRMYDAGIPGNKYLSGFTRHSRDWMSPDPQDFNYVAYSEDLPKIIDWYDWPRLKQGEFPWYKAR